MTQITETWWNLKGFLNARGVGIVITRKELLSRFDLSPSKETSVDHYRLHLTKLGYLEIVSRGVYKLNKIIPLGLTLNKK